jgi:integrase/recombinase XerC
MCVQSKLKEHAMPVTEVTRIDAERSRWDDAFYAFLAEKERRSGSLRTVQSYSRMLATFFAQVEKTPDHVVSTDVFSWAHGVGLSGCQPSSVTVGARIACLSSFYRFLIRMDLLIGNPCERLERPRTVPGVPKGMSAEQIQTLLAVVPDTKTGLRDRAIIAPSY